MEIQVTKLTDVSLLRAVAGNTSGRECRMSLAKAYALGHSPIRTQFFLIDLKDIPQFVASQLVRHKIGAEWWMKSKRTDRKGGMDFKLACRSLADRVENISKHPNGKDESVDIFNRIHDLPNNFDRLAPTDLMGILNAQAIINISRDRLCAAASKETREVWENVITQLAYCDPELANHCVRPCVANGVCREHKCNFIDTTAYCEQRAEYIALFD